jgi:hypothetical protein
MQPLTLENDAEFECLNTLNKSETEKCDPWTFMIEYFASDDMKYEAFFHTSGSSRWCYNSRYEFCPDTGLFVHGNDTRWW